MSMTLLLWKAPVVSEPADADELLQPFYDRSDDSVFEPSPDIKAMSSELLRRFPDADGGPWADGPPDPEADRLLVLSIRWKADDAALDAIAELAREHRLVLYDPQGPDIHLPDDPIDTEPAPPPGLMSYLTFVLMAVVSAGVAIIGWKIDVPVVGWGLMIIGGFFFAVVVFVLGVMMFGRDEEPAAKGDAREG